MKFLCQFGLNPSSGSGGIVQTKSYADAADADGIHTKNNMSPTPSEGGHNFDSSLLWMLNNNNSNHLYIKSHTYININISFVELFIATKKIYKYKYIRGVIKNYVDFSYIFWLYYSIPLKLTMQIFPCYRQWSAKSYQNPFIHYKITVKWKHPLSPSWSGLMTSVTLMQKQWFWTTKCAFLVYWFLHFYCSKYVKQLSTIGAWFKLPICLKH